MITQRIERTIQEIVADVTATDSRESKMLEVQMMLRKAANEIEHKLRQMKFKSLKGAL